MKNSPSPSQGQPQQSILYLADDVLIFDFPYDPDQVSQVKALPGAKWDKVGRVWRLPVSSLKQVRDLALKWNFDISNEVLAFDLPAHVNPGDGVSIEGKYLMMSFRYDPVMVRSVKQIPSVTWDAKTKAWKAPLTSIESVIKWATTFRQPIPDHVRAEADRISASLTEIREASRSVDADISIPRLHGELLPYQRAGVSYASHTRRSFIADEMGLGKTIQAMATLDYIHSQYGDDDTSPVYPAVVVCPPSLVLNWKKEYNKFFPDLIVETVTNRKEIPMFGTYDVLIVGYSNITAWEKQLCNHNAYVFDESHYCKSREAQRTKSAKKMTKSNKDAVVLCLTGTPVTNRPAEYAPQLDIMGQLDKFGGLWGFYRRYCNPPEAPIWMADFTHRALGEIKVGDKIIGWDGMNGGNRRLKESIVLAVNHRKSRIVKVRLASGRVIRCTPDHLWISGKGRRWDYKNKKLKADCFVEAKPGKSLAFAVSPIPACPESLVRTASWLGGIYDGEGTCQRIAQSRSFNPEIYQRIEDSLTELGFDYSHQADGMGLNFLGGKSEFARFLAWCKPTKNQWLRERALGPNFERDDVVSVEDDGFGEVISLTTSTGNYFAWGYASKNCNAFQDKWGQWHLEGHSNLEELNDKLRATCYIRRTKDQVMSELPPVIHDEVVIDGTPAIMKEYKKAEADIVAYLVERAKQIAEELGLPIGAATVMARLKAEANEHLVRMSVLRKIAAKAKMAVVEEWVDSRIADGKKVVIAAHHREIVDSLASRYGGLKIQGGMDVEDVEDAKHKFQTLPVEKAPVIVLSIQAAKTGHTLTAAQDVLFVELPWTPADVDQTYSRCHRIGQKGSVTSTYMLTSGTIDEEIYSLIERKRAVVGKATEGDMGFDEVDASSIILKLLNI